MAHIKTGDLVVSFSTGNRYIAVGDDYVWSFIPVVKVINPVTGKESVEYLSSLRKL